MGSLSLGRKVKICYQGKPIFGRDIFNREIVIGDDGQIYFKYWDPDLNGLNTPEQRLKKVFSPAEVKWRRFPNLGGVERGLILAKARGGLSIQRFEEFEKMFKQEIRAGIIEVKKIDGEVAKKIRRQLFGYYGYIAGSPKKGLKETVSQIIGIFLLRDKDNRINPCAIFARITAVDGRLAERLGELNGWLPHFSGRLFAVRALKHEIEKRIKRLPASLNLVERDANFRKGKIQPAEATQLRNAVGISQEEIFELAVFGQFRRWVELTIKDLKSLDRAISHKNFNQAFRLIFKIKNAVEVKLVQLELESLIEKIDIDNLLSALDWESYKQSILKIRSHLLQIDESGFAEPVCKKAMYLLLSVYLEGDINKLKRGIKEVHAIL